MKRAGVSILGLLACFSLAVASLSLSSRAAPGEESSADLRAFAALDPIDAHVHDFKIDPALVAFLSRVHLHVLDIVVVSDRDKFDKGLEPRVRFGLAVVRASEGRALLCTSFDPFKFGEANFADDAIRRMNQDFADGAIAVKIWKNVGMELKTPQGKFVMPDDPAFQPIYQTIAAHDKTLIAHLAEPDACWQSPDVANNNCKDHPDWYMYGRAGVPAKAAILAARDHLLEINPKLRVVGAHLGSMESDVDEIARRFERYPNFAVDTAARLRFLSVQPRDKVRAFFVKYQDRILYGTDLDAYPNDDTADILRRWEQTYLRDWKFFATDETQDFEGHKVQGLNLPGPVLRKLYHGNAAHWIPGSAGK